ncbi:MAG: 23S rRNA (pseudouridine(1915)-N(3))-methyltransferase RlmH [Magnetococcales bacterium]|nr:23S rRNA (pseudouridine(1915)-N(3))-methyltransferase RlmH [Magnetococcales bacterium]
MRFTILAIGRGMEPAIAQLVKNYLARLNRMLPVELIEVAEERRLSEQSGRKQVAMMREAKRLEIKLSDSPMVVPLDSHGMELSSEDLARRLEKIIDQGVREVTFVIGGPDGLDQGILQNRSWILSLGLMTYPHMLVRVLLLEQLYRAMCILKKLPYHR